MVYPHNEIPLGNKKESTVDTHNNRDKSQNNYADRSQTKIEYMLYDCTYIKF